MKHVLIVDDDADSAATLRELVGVERFSVAVAHSLRDARRQMALQTPHLVLLDLQLPDGNGMELFSDPRAMNDSRFVLVTGHASLDSSIEALRRGAMDYLVKPVGLGRLEQILAGFRSPRNALAAPAAQRQGWAAEGRFGGLWGRSPAMKRVHEQIDRVAPTSVTVFISGESGTGKEVVAQTVHALSKRRDGPFLAINCGAISPHLIESEIFGHEKGSFTGAERQHQGFFERAAGGTLFLDEITEMPPQLQVKLLRVLETGRFMRVGSTQSQEADVRIVTATNRSPHEAVAQGRLREDLLYRLNVFPIELPPLRARLSDVPLLAAHFLREIVRREGQHRQFSAAALEQLSRHGWPGNVRELRNAVQRAYVMADGATIGTEWLPAPDAAAADRRAELHLQQLPATAPGAAVLNEGMQQASLNLPIGTSMAQAEQLLIQATLKQCMYQRERTAAMLGISLKTLYNRLKTYAGAQQPSHLHESP
ncbi:Regulatory protein luxO [Delftia tsuruhatensis]|uniref:sigma-54-dependent transcriptional regulator n=1 Tax=Delftia tsuruhatensis TaxID=180282 RepID=UPI001E79F02D|nr:sigma-54 dependent transcriptional regulator [Delftia tsuruhatensis]CAB5712404.1 Regulatory protein luxO [Delftia tsuruhatensis]CAC9682045.1 Regulatory protein luxO [Delftia tsuruhatensis]